MKKTLRFAGILATLFLLLIISIYWTLTNQAKKTPATGNSSLSLSEKEAVLRCIEEGGKVETIINKNYCKFSKPLKLCTIAKYATGECGPREPMTQKQASGATK